MIAPRIPNLIGSATLQRWPMILGSIEAQPKLMALA
jgi:hypothetical protein